MKKKVKLKPGTIERRKAKAKVMKQLAKAGKESRARKAKELKNPGSVNGSAALASKGNNWWNMRSKHGRDKLFTNPDLLWEAACEYFDYVKNNPMHSKIEHKVINGRLKTISTPLVSVLTMEGLCMYLGCTITYFETFKVTLPETDVNRKDFLVVLEFIKQTVRQNKFTGAADGTFNATLIAYDLGLRNDQVAANSPGIIINIEKEAKTVEALNEVQKKLADLDKDEKI